MWEFVVLCSSRKWIFFVTYSKNPKSKLVISSLPNPDLALNFLLNHLQLVQNLAFELHRLSLKNLNFLDKSLLLAHNKVSGPDDFLLELHKEGQKFSDS